jgi:hypothetical protein
MARQRVMVVHSHQKVERDVGHRSLNAIDAMRRREKQHKPVEFPRAESVRTNSETAYAVIVIASRCYGKAPFLSSRCKLQLCIAESSENRDHLPGQEPRWAVTPQVGVPR